MLFMGIDVGTQGVRVIVADEKGRIAGRGSVPFRSLNLSGTPDRYEQSPDEWWTAAAGAIAGAVDEMKRGGDNPLEIAFA